MSATSETNGRKPACGMILLLGPDGHSVSIQPVAVENGVERIATPTDMRGMIHDADQHQPALRIAEVLDAVAAANAPRVQPVSPGARVATVAGGKAH